jgi:hypothetical protein
MTYALSLQLSFPGRGVPHYNQESNGTKDARDKVTPKEPNEAVLGKVFLCQ